MMSVCLNEERLQAYLDDELSPDAAAAVISHLNGCAACDALARDLGQAMTLIESAFDEELPESVPTASLRARMEEAVAMSSSAAPSSSFGQFSLRRLVDSLNARLQDISPLRFGLAAAIVLIAIILAGGLAGGLAGRLRQSSTSKKDVVQRGDTKSPERKLSDQPVAQEQTGAKAGDKAGRKELKRFNRADIADRYIKPKPDRIEQPEQNEPAMAITTFRRAKHPANPTLRNEGTSEHLRQTQFLLRSVRNTPIEVGGAAFDLAYEKRLSRELLSKNRLLRRSAENKEDSQVEELLNDIEPLLLDIAHLPDKPTQGELLSVQELIREQKIIAMLQIYSAKEVQSPASRRKRITSPNARYGQKPAA